MWLIYGIEAGLIAGGFNYWLNWPWYVTLSASLVALNLVWIGAAARKFLTVYETFLEYGKSKDK